MGSSLLAISPTWDRVLPQLLFMGSWGDRINTKGDGPGLWAAKERLLVQAYDAKFRVPTIAPKFVGPFLQVQ